ncbi:hypothetical protein RB598_006937 [Gaeumannomyces tritici]
MRYPTISAFLLATTLPTTMSASVRLDSPSETGEHMPWRRLADELDTPTREELSALDADEAGGVGSSSPIAQNPPTFVLRRTNSDGQSVSSDSAGSALSDADLASILAVSGGSSVYERSIDERDDGGDGSAQSWASRRRRSLSALVRRACRPSHHGQDPKYRHSSNCERSAPPAEGEAEGEAEAEAPDQQIRSLVSDKPTFEGAVKEVFYSHEAKRGVAGWVSRRRARSNASA